MKRDWIADATIWLYGIVLIGGVLIMFGALVRAALTYLLTGTMG